MFLKNYILLNLIFVNYTFLDVPEHWQMGFQEAANPIMEGIINLHHNLFFILMVIVVFVCWMLFRTLYFFYYKNHPVAYPLVHGTTIELVWTLTPSLILILIATPSFTLLYSLDEVIDPAVTVKVIGKQWFWSYEYSDFNSAQTCETVGFDSYMIPEEDLNLGQLRMLEVDQRMIIPANTFVRLIITGADVIHSWAVPSFGVKCDALPGRLNQISLFVKREGIFYGQCSEICGVNHAAMPIVVEVVSVERFISWILNKM
uniref:cytochrome c oxidase subunit 2 n=1 Tax=Glaucosphaera vacuolata TaxID=38265 RepID=UPI001FCE115C|nr:cytochrome c oxidase subunit 2 [Glaucosphaera vacuolata]UNJ18766.1 cytochrome c oxidase subunit 2 [Glaucosphaera vacuolata]